MQEHTIRYLQYITRLSGKELAKLTGIHPVNISNIMTGNRVETKTHRAFVRVLLAIHEHDQQHPECAIMPGLLTDSREDEKE